MAAVHTRLQCQLPAESPLVHRTRWAEGNSHRIEAADNDPAAVDTVPTLVVDRDLLVGSYLEGNCCSEERTGTYFQEVRMDCLEEVVESHQQNPRWTHPDEKESK